MWLDHGQDDHDASIFAISGFSERAPGKSSQECESDQIAPTRSAGQDSLMRDRLIDSRIPSGARQSVRIGYGVVRSGPTGRSRSPDPPSSSQSTNASAATLSDSGLVAEFARRSGRWMCGVQSRPGLPACRAATWIFPISTPAFSAIGSRGASRRRRETPIAVDVVGCLSPHPSGGKAGVVVEAGHVPMAAVRHVIGH